MCAVGGQLSLGDPSTHPEQPGKDRDLEERTFAGAATGAAALQQATSRDVLGWRVPGAPPVPWEEITGWGEG